MRGMRVLYRRLLLHLLQFYLSGNGWRADRIALYLSQRIDRMDARHYLALASRRKPPRAAAPRPAPPRRDKAA